MGGSWVALLSYRTGLSWSQMSGSGTPVCCWLALGAIRARLFGSALAVLLCTSVLPVGAYWGIPPKADSTFALWCDTTRGEYDRVVNLAMAMMADSSISVEEAALMGRPRPRPGTADELFMRQQLANAWCARGNAKGWGGQLEQGLACFREAQTILESLGDVFANANMRCFAADLYLFAGRYTEAVITMQPAAQEYLLHGDTAQAVDALWTIARALGDQGNYAAAAREYQRALDLHGSRQAYRRFCFLAEFARYEVDAGHADEAFALIAQARSSIDNGTTHDVRLQLGSATAKAHLLRGDCRQAMDIASPLLDSARSNSELMASVPDLAATMSEALVCLGHGERALKYAMECLRMADLLRMKMERSNALRLMSLAYKSIGNASMALLYMERYHAAKDSIVSAEAMAEANRTVLLAEFQRQQIADSIRTNEDRAREASANARAQSRNRTQRTVLLLGLLLVAIIAGLLLNRAGLKRRLQVAQLRASLSRDLHDDIGSTLSSINILSNVARRKAEVMGNTDAAASLDRISDRSQRLMRNMSDIVWSVDPNKDTLEELILRMRDLATSVLEGAGIAHTIDFPQSIPAIALAAGTKNNLYLVFKEAINNVVKHAKAVHVEVVIRINDGIFRLMISDDGSGMDPAAATNGHGGNGLRNMRTRATELKASLRIITALGGGTKLTLDVPMA